MDKISKVVMENGYYLFKLYQILDERNISINKLMNDTKTDFKVIQRIATGELVRIDIIVLARLCNYLECEIQDIVEYIAKRMS